ncbi:hypothetical protein C8R41DRAFT_832414 [Lentinula lateritia]|uniref:Uncharacterized protein n=1 Tax=Lentinula lateritia TaxID=40482 RepID=A0ABQ8VFJ6_9AGAR|nr:hypothetical protein C8R41DRAFT_832414 [Lentinula lateritia]
MLIQVYLSMPLLLDCTIVDAETPLRNMLPDSYSGARHEDHDVQRYIPPDKSNDFHKASIPVDVKYLMISAVSTPTAIYESIVAMLEGHL